MKYGLKKDLPNKETPKKSKKNIIILVILLVICSAAGFVFLKKVLRKAEVIEVIPTKDELAFDNIPDDTISELDTLNITDSSVVEQPLKQLYQLLKSPK